MRVLFVNGSSSPLKCGVGYYGEALAKALGDTVEPHLLTTSGLGAKSNPGTVHFVNDWKIRRLSNIIRTIKQVQPDIVHLQYPAVGFGRQLGINLLCLLLRIIRHELPVIVTLHEYYGSGMLGKLRDIMTVFAAHKIIVSNQLDYDRLPRFLRKKLMIIPIGHNVPISKPNYAVFQSLVRTADFSSKKPTIAYFGFINPSKGVDTLVRAAPKLNAQVLLLAELSPSDPYHAHILALVAEAKQKGAAIHVAGFLENSRLSQVLQECQLFALPQPLPLTAKSGTAITAAEHGLVIVSTAAAKITYNLPYINGNNAILLDIVTEESFAAACNDLLHNQQKLHDMQHNAKKLADYFSWQSIALKHLELYASVSSR